MVVSVQIAPPDFDRVFAALADHTRRDIVRRAISAEEGVLELASHYPMSFAAVQKHVAVLERAGLITKQRIGRRKVVRTNLDALLVARRVLDQYEELWRARVDRMNDPIADAADATHRPINTIRVGIEEVAQGRTRMSIEIVFASTEAMELALAMGTDEGLSQAVSQIDAILAEETIRR